MAWTTTAWANADWSLLANVNDFIDAVRERNKAIANGSEPDGIAQKEVGDDVQDHAWWLALQTWIEDNMGSFIICADAGEMRAAGYYDNHDTVDAYDNLATLFSAAGLETETWRAYTTHPDDGGADQSQKIRAGDIIGPWLFEDLQAVLNVLVWSRRVTNWTAKEETNANIGDGGGITWAAAKVVAEAVWDGGGELASVDAPPGAVSFGTGDVGNFFGYINRAYAYGTIANLWNGVSRAVDWYVFAVKPSGGDPLTWDANGDDVIEDKYSHWQTDDPATDDTTVVSSSVVGTIASKPTWVSQPTGGDRKKGWVAVSIILNKRSVIRWNIVDGFTYTM